MRKYRDFKKEVLKNKGVMKAYRDLGPQFEVIRMVIEKRMQKGVTQKKLAQMAGTKQSAISRFESGESNPTLSFLDRLANALDAEIKISVK